MATTNTANRAQEEVNWLEHWEGTLFISDPDDRDKIKFLKRKLRIYVRGELAEFNALYGTHYVVKRFVFDRMSRDPLLYSLKAFLEPPAQADPDEDPEGGGGHLIPPPPPPPGKIE